MAGLTKGQVIIKIQNLEFKQKAFYDDPFAMHCLIEYLSALSFGEKSLHIVQKLIKFFKLPVLICFKKMYMALEPKKKVYFHDDLMSIAKMVKQILGQYQFQQLSFFFDWKQGLSFSTLSLPQKYRKLKNISQEDLEFQRYAYRLSTCISLLKQLIKVYLVSKNKVQLSSWKGWVDKLSKHWEGALLQNNFIYKNYSLLTLEKYYVSGLVSQFEKTLFSAKVIYQQNHKLTINDFVDCNKNEQISKQGSKTKLKLKIDQLVSSQIVRKQIVKMASSQFFQAQILQPICCRQFFYLGQPINQDSNIVVIGSFVDNFYTENKNLLLSQSEIYENIKREACSLLNCEGGTIFLGLSANPCNSILQVEGLQLIEDEKQQIYKNFRRVMQQIKPDIVSNRMYDINFIPIKLSNKKRRTRRLTTKKIGRDNYIEGYYLVRINISYGKRDEIYSYTSGKLEHFTFRKGKQAYNMRLRQVLDLAKKINLQQLPIPKRYHRKICKKPHQGFQMYKRVFGQSGLKCEQNPLSSQKQKENPFYHTNEYLIVEQNMRSLLLLDPFQDITTLCCISNISDSILHLKNKQSNTREKLKRMRNLLKQIYKLRSKDKFFRIVPITDCIFVNHQQIENTLQILLKKGKNFKISELQDGLSIIFMSTNESTQFYIELKKTQIQCQFKLQFQ